MGTWSCPNTEEKASQLKELMQKPLLKEDAVEQLYDLVGDDDLFDKIGYFEEGFDVRYSVIETVKDWLKRLDDFFEAWDKKAIIICHDIVNNTEL